MAPKRKRPSRSEEDQEDNASVESGSSSPERESKRRFARLKPQVKNISKRTIKSKWSSLSEPAQGRVRDLIKALERPVIVRQREEKKRIEAQTALKSVVRTLERRLPRMPFPPLTKEAVFDYEAVLNEHRVLETQLSTTRNTIDLLKMEVEREEALLAKELAYVETMEKNAKKAELERRRQMKNEHPVLKLVNEESGNGNDGHISAPFTILDRKDDQTAICEIRPDSEMQSVVTQLAGHLTSMQNNFAPFVALREAISEAQAALDLVPLPPD